MQGDQKNINHTDHFYEVGENIGGRLAICIYVCVFLCFSSYSFWTSSSLDVCSMCMYGHTYSKSMDQPGKVANPARRQLNRENRYFPVRVRA